MKKLVVVLVALMVVCGPTYTFAQTQKAVKLDPENIKKALEITKRNEALLKDKEMMERYQRLVRALNNKKSNQQ